MSDLGILQSGSPDWIVGLVYLQITFCGGNAPIPDWIKLKNLSRIVDWIGLKKLI